MMRSQRTSSRFDFHLSNRQSQPNERLKENIRENAIKAQIRLLYYYLILNGKTYYFIVSLCVVHNYNSNNEVPRVKGVQEESLNRSNV